MLRVGIVGAGRIGAKRAHEVARAADARLVAVADANLQRAEALAKSYGARASSSWETVVAARDIDAVVVATPHNWLAPIAGVALESHKHVLCEKPLATTAEQAAKLVTLAARNDRKLKTGFNHRHHAAIAQAHALAGAGQIGRLVFIRCRYGHGGRAGYEQEWRVRPTESGGGELLDQGIHALDLFRWFLGELSEVTAMLGQTFWPVPVEDNAFCILRTPTRQLASLHASWTQWKNVFSFEVFGEQGYLLAEGLGGSYGPERLVLGRRPASFGVPAEQSCEFDGEDVSWAREWEEFASAIREDRQPLASGYDGWQALRLAEAAYQSAQRHCAISVSEGEDHAQPAVHRGVSGWCQAGGGNH